MANTGRQQVDVPFSLGLDQKSDVRYLSAGAGAQIINAVRLKESAIRKRFGNVAISNAMTTPIAGGTVGASPIVAITSPAGGSQHAVVSDSEDSVVATQVMSVLSECIATPRVPVMSQVGGGNIADWDVASWGNYVFVATLNFGTYLTAYKTVVQYDVTTWQIVATVSFGQGYVPKLLVIGNTLYLFASQAGTIYCARWTLAANTPIGPVPDTILVGGGSGVIPYDVCAIPGTGYFDLAYVLTAGTLNLSTYNSALVLQNGVTRAIVSATVYSVACTCRGPTYPHWVAYEQFPTVATTFAWCASDNGSGVVGASTGAPVSAFTLQVSATPGKIDIIWSPVASTAAIVSGSSATAMGGWPAATAVTTHALVQNASGPATLGSPLVIPSILLGSRLTYLASGQLVAFFYLPSKLQPSSFLWSLDGFTTSTNLSTTLTPRPIALSCARTAGVGWGTPNGNPANAVNQHIAALPTTAKGIKSAGIVLCDPFAASAFNSQLNLQPFDFRSPLQYQSCEVNAGEVCASGIPQAFDGLVDMEAYTVAYPEILFTQLQSGGSVDVGSHNYIAIFEWIDNAGNRRQTAYGAPATVTTTSGTQTVKVSASAALTETFAGLYPTFTNTVQPVITVSFYRTLLNGTTYYRVSPDPSTIVASWCTSTGAVQYVSFVDSASDASISTGATAEVLFDTGGVLDPVCPPSSSICVKHQNRVFFSGGPDPNLIWPSTQITSGLMPTWNESLNITATGAVTALASMDSNLIIFVQRGAQFGIEYVSGYGPNNLGTNSDWTPPTPIQSDTAAVDWRCVCSIPAGLLFRGTTGGPNGSGGIFLLSRALQVSYVSDPIEDLLAQYPVVTSMVTHPNNGRVYITCATSDSLTSASTGIRLVYDYLHDGTWTVDYLQDPTNSNTQCAVRTAFVGYSSAVGGMAYYWASGGGALYRETVGIGTNSYTDAGSYVPIQYKSAWLKPSQSGSARFHTVQLQADALDAHNLTVSLNFDYAPSSYYTESPASWTWSQIQAFDRAPQEDIQITPLNQKSKAIQVVISESAPSNVTYPDQYPMTIGVTPSVWLRADVGVVLGASNAVDAWIDQSGNGNNALAQSSIGRPALLSVSPSFGNKPSVVFNGTNQYLLIDSNAWCQSTNTMFVVCLITGSLNVGVVSEIGYGVGILYFGDSSTLISYWGTTAVGTVVSRNVAIVAAFVGNTTSGAGYVNSTAATVTGSTGVLALPGAISIGGGEGNLTGAIAEVICYQGALTPAQIAGVNSYLSQKYGASIAGYTPINWTTGQGPSLASLSLDFDVGDGLYPNLPTGQKA